AVLTVGVEVVGERAAPGAERSLRCLLTRCTVRFPLTVLVAEDAPLPGPRRAAPGGGNMRVVRLLAVVAFLLPAATHAGTDTWTSAGPEGGSISALVPDGSGRGVAATGGATYTSDSHGDAWTLRASISHGATALAVTPA